VGLRTSLDDVVKRKFLSLPGLELRLLRRHALSQSLYNCVTRAYKSKHTGNILDKSEFVRFEVLKAMVAGM
jgi:hypothetical protein